MIDSVSIICFADRWKLLAVIKFCGEVGMKKSEILKRIAEVMNNDAACCKDKRDEDLEYVLMKL